MGVVLDKVILPARHREPVEEFGYVCVDQGKFVQLMQMGQVFAASEKFGKIVLTGQQQTLLLGGGEAMTKTTNLN
ncbi:hypothetical protein Jiend_37410 [Micromonospora endophytica]|nr:hypothetical protein Jiend_37410 [Micromonospora endophytica]